jgi:hypothetical protein
MIRSVFVYLFLTFVCLLSRLFYRFQQQWIGPIPKDPWAVPFRLVAILNHTSLFEFLYAGITSRKFLWRMARHGTVPIADITIDRPIVGIFWRFIAGNIVPVSRERDATWDKVMESIHDPDAMVIILPEGRMKRASGLDKYGRNLQVRGGIADLLMSIPDGELLLAYSQGLHHIQIPGQHLPRFFKPVRMRLEIQGIRALRESLMAGLDPGDAMAFRKRVIQDLTERRDRYCTSNRGGEDEPEGTWPKGRFLRAEDSV